MKKKTLWSRFQEWLFTVVGDLTWQGIFHPFWILYKPIHYKVNSEDQYDLIEFVLQNELKPGDILLRRYDKYFSSFFIPGDFKHAGLYVGIDPKTKKHTIVHSLSEGVLKEDIINFFRTDYIAIVRPKLDPKYCNQAVQRAYDCLGRPYDFDFRYTDSLALYCTELIGYCYEPFKDKFKFKLVETGIGPMKRKVLIADNILRSNVELLYYTHNCKKFKTIQEKLNEQSKN